MAVGSGFSAGVAENGVSPGLGNDGEPPDDVTPDWAASFVPTPRERGAPVAGDDDVDQLFREEEQEEDEDSGPAPALRFASGGHAGHAGHGPARPDVANVVTPLWEEYSDYVARGGAYILLIQRVTPEGRTLDVVELDAGASRAQILAAVQEPGTYLATPIDCTTGRALRPQPYRVAYAEDHFQLRQRQAHSALRSAGMTPLSPSPVGTSFDPEKLFRYLDGRDARSDDRRAELDRATADLIGKQLEGASSLYKSALDSEAQRAAAAMAAERERNEAALKLHRETLEAERVRIASEAATRIAMHETMASNTQSFAQQLALMERDRMAAEERRMREERQERERRDREDRIDRERREREDRDRREKMDAERAREQREYMERMSQASNPLNAIATVAGLVTAIAPVLEKLGVADMLKNAVTGSGQPAQADDNIYSVLKETVKTIGTVAGGFLGGGADDGDDDEGEEEELDEEEEIEEEVPQIEAAPRRRIAAQPEPAAPAQPDPNAGAYREVAAVHELAHLRKRPRGVQAEDTNDDGVSGTNTEPAPAAVKGPREDKATRDGKRAISKLLVELRTKPEAEWLETVMAAIGASKPAQARFKALGITAASKEAGATDEEVATVLRVIDAAPPMVQAFLDGVPR